MKHYGKNVVIVLALLGAGFFAAWLRFRPYLGHQDLYTDGERTYATSTSEEIRYAVWDIPERLTNEINTPALEGRPTLTGDGRFLVFSVGEPGLNSDLFLVEMIDGQPDRPTPIVALNSDYDESAPAFADGYLYFASNRPGGAGGLDIYRAEFLDGVIGEVEPVGPGVNTEANETDPTPIPDSPDIAFASDRAAVANIENYDLYTATAPGFGAPADSPWDVAAINAVNGNFNEREPAFAADGRTLLFSTDRVTSLGGYDIFRSILDRGQWLPPEIVPGVNSDQDERGPYTSSDGFSLWFSAEMEPGDFDIFRARSLELFRIPGRPVGWLDLTILASLLLLALLAVLAKRWERMDIVYKCFLVSVVLHLLLLWWFQKVVPEPGEGTAPSQRESLFTVSLAIDRSAQQARRQERSGQLDFQRSERPEVEAPQRQQSDQPQEQALDSAPTKALAKAQSQAQRGPQRRQEQMNRAAKAVDPNHAQQQVQTQQPTETIQRIQGRVPTLSVAAQSIQQGERELRQGDPNRTAVVVNRNTAAAPSSGEVALATQAPVWVPDAAPSEAAPTREVGVTEAPVALAQPTEQLARKEGVVADLALDATEMALPEADFSEEIERAAHGAPLAELDQAPPNLETASTIEFQPDAALAMDDSWMPSRESFQDTPDPLARESDVAVSLQDEEAIPLPDPETLVMAEPEMVTGPSMEFDRSDAQPDAGEVSPTRFSRESSFEAPELRPTRRREFARADVGSSLAEPTPLRKTSTEISRERAFKEPSIAMMDKPKTLERPTQTELTEETPALAMDLTARRSSPSRRPVTDPGSPERRRFDRRQRLDPIEPKIRTLDAEPIPQEPAKVLAETPSRLVHTPYRSRFGTEKQVALEKFGGSTETEQAVARGLEYLAKVQASSGHWGSSDDFHEKYGHVSVGKTALCTLAFLGAGHTHQSNTQYSDVVKKSVTFLLESQDPGSGHFGYSSAYSHGVATYALAELYALTKDKELELPLRRAIDHILQQQYGGLDRRRSGGWGYYNASGDHYDNWPRASVTSWQVMALKSSRIGGLDVPDEAFQSAREFLLNTYDERQQWFRYNHSPERLNSGYPTLPGSTPAAMFALSLMGEELSDPRWDGARSFILNRAPRRYRFTNDDDFVLKARGNLYFWYYATLSMFRAQGKDWEFWNERMKKTLLPAQAKDGSWQPISVYARYAGDDNRDRSYTTAMCVLTLEVYYRYFTPLLQDN